MSVDKVSGAIKDSAHTLIVNADLLFREAREVDYTLAVGVDVQKIYARTEVLH